MIKVLEDYHLRCKDNFCIGTHNGIFHADEVIATSILNILYEGEKDVEVLRTRDLDLLYSVTDIIIDVGGGFYDHHQKGGNGQRENGVKYASAGLIWRDFGIKTIHKLTDGLTDAKLTLKSKEKIFKMIDNDIIQNIDKEDNGQNQVVHPFQFIKQFLPEWYDLSANVDKNFESCVNICSEILTRIIKGYISNELARKEIESRLNSFYYRSGDILFINSQTMPWLESVIDYNNKNEDTPIDFVVFEYPAGGYALQCVPPSIEDSFSQRVPLPKNWAGETTDLPVISGVRTATFCHGGRFFARAKELSDIVIMCNLAREEYNKEIGNIPVRKKSNQNK